ncbi:MAG TPA: PPOX class F420-dependent oxidoreductase [Candidatus Nitrosopolaris rasttigaisensis]|nr:PPOX class F420-dependent oxidoreductase [Candidatus Nitrosopolaris rasttigaisensis]
MSKEEIQTFLMSGTLTGKISTVRKDGRPHVVPIWFILENDDYNIKVVFTTGQDSLKAKHLLRDPRVSFCVDDQTPPFSFISIEGIAEINKEPDLSELLKWATKIAGRYMGQDIAEAYGKRNAVKGEFLVRIRPTKIIAQKDMVG